MIRSVFLDRDGVINKLIPDQGKERSPRTMEEFVFTDGVKDFVASVRTLGFTVIVITNQPEVKRGFVSKELVSLFHDKIHEELGIKDFFVCWHDNEDQCDCRKPKPGLLIQAAKALAIDLKKSFMVGDRSKDISAASSAGCTGILYGNTQIANTFSSTSFIGILNFIKNEI